MIYYVLIVMLNSTSWKSKAFGGVAQRQSNGLLNRGSRYRNSPSPPKVRKNLNPSAKDVKGEVFRYIPEGVVGKRTRQPANQPRF